MSWKLFVSLLFVFGLLLASCSAGSNPDESAWPDDDDIATMIALTLTQRAESGLQDTPQPGEQNEANQEIADSTVVASDQISEGTNSGDNFEEVQAGEGSEQSFVEIGIPGMNALELVERLVGFGFDCPEPELRAGIYERRCIFETVDYQYAVTVWGKMIETVDLIEAAAFYFGDQDYTDLTSVVFELVGQTPYDGAVPDDAGRWVSSSLAEIQLVGDEALNEFGGVRFYLYALPSAQILEIGQP
jgi:hypothetical protein